MIETVDRNEDWKISYSEFRVQQILFLSIVFFNNRTVGTRMWDLNLGLKMFVLYFKGYHSTAPFRALWFCVEANAPRQKCQECQFFLPQTLRAQFFQQKRMQFSLNSFSKSANYPSNSSRSPSQSRQILPSITPIFFLQKHQFSRVKIYAVI